MKLVVLLILFGAAVSELSFEWDKFKRDYNKNYASAAEEIERKEIFIENINRMRAYQQTYPDASFTMSINYLADRRIQELVSRLKTHIESRPTIRQSSIETKNLPESLDWRDKGVIGPVSELAGEIVTAVVSTELIESLHAIHTKNFIEGSIQRVFDCCPQPADTFICIQNMSGICRKNDYPVALETCEPNKCIPFTTFNKINRLIPGDEGTMLIWIQDSTLWAEIDATGVGFISYTSGIYDDPTCSQTQIDQAVQIVGYGIEGGRPYWLCKNNWGANWGDQGYFRIARGKNMCAIATVVIQVASTETTTTTHYTSSTTQLSTSSATQPSTSTSSATQSSTGTSSATQISTSTATQSSTSTATQSSTSSTTQSSTSTSSATQLYTISSIHLMVIFVMVTIAQTILIYN
ncbi:unnamed protein product [Adineta steineri]|uniref:Peptidase C1A papain C-terminal domain-containing protein n=1 Tax=Adineta steineri TaxID=433720 RepID=A0A818MFL3_9BILA|nr:unnamed protein product [Adineta steineri]CAF3582054.1 unnamed protein product [Adineta steineri]